MGITGVNRNRHNHYGGANEAVVTGMALICGYLTNVFSRRADGIERFEIDLPWQNISDLWINLINLNGNKRIYDPRAAYNQFNKDDRVKSVIVVDMLKLKFEVQNDADLDFMYSLGLQRNVRLSLHPEVSGQYEIIPRHVPYDRAVVYESLRCKKNTSKTVLLHDGKISSGGVVASPQKKKPAEVDPASKASSAKQKKPDVVQAPSPVPARQAKPAREKPARVSAPPLPRKRPCVARKNTASPILQAILINEDNESLFNSPADDSWLMNVSSSVANDIFAPPPRGGSEQPQTPQINFNFDFAEDTQQPLFGSEDRENRAVPEAVSQSLEFAPNAQVPPIDMEDPLVQQLGNFDDYFPSSDAHGDKLFDSMWRNDDN